MRYFKINKLVRDKTTTRLEQRDFICHGSHLNNDHAYNIALRAKLMEEAEEVVHAETSDALASELADVTEVVHALAQLHHLSLDDIEALRQKKYTERGGFSQRVFQTYCESPTSNTFIDSLLFDRIKYPELTNPGPCNEKNCYCLKKPCQS